MDAEPVEPDDTDDAERAFEALREEVAALRRGMELMYRQMQQARPQAEAAGPDYSSTLGEISKALRAMEKRLGAIEDKPAQREVYVRPTIEMPGTREGAADASAIRMGLEAMRETSREFKEVLVGARSRRTQQATLGATGIAGVTMGVGLWLLTVAALPTSASHRLAALMIDTGGRWAAGETLMQEADPYRWKRFAELAQACSEGVQTEKCEAMVIVRTIASPPPALVLQTPAADLSRSKVGQGR